MVFAIRAEYSLSLSKNDRLRAEEHVKERGLYQVSRFQTNAPGIGLVLALGLVRSRRLSLPASVSVSISVSVPCFYFCPRPCALSESRSDPKDPQVVTVASAKRRGKWKKEKEVKRGRERGVGREGGRNPSFGPPIGVAALRRP